MVGVARGQDAGIIREDVVALRLNQVVVAQALVDVPVVAAPRDHLPRLVEHLDIIVAVRRGVGAGGMNAPVARQQIADVLLAAAVVDLHQLGASHLPGRARQRSVEDAAVLRVAGVDDELHVLIVEIAQDVGVLFEEDDPGVDVLMLAVGVDQLLLEDDAAFALFGDGEAALFVRGQLRTPELAHHVVAHVERPLVALEPLVVRRARWQHLLADVIGRRADALWDDEL